MYHQSNGYNVKLQHASQKPNRKSIKIIKFEYLTLDFRTKLFLVTTHKE